MKSIEIAGEALREIASRGVVRYSSEDLRDGNGKAVQAYGCPVCRHLQNMQGTCNNRECLTNIARTAIEAMKVAGE